MESFGTWLRNKRKVAGLTLRELDKLLETSYVHIANIEKDQIKPSEKLAIRIADYFQCDREKVLFMAREVAEEIKDIKEKYPNESKPFLK